MEYVLGLDIGTSGVKVLLISKEGEPVGVSSSSYPLSTPKGGWAEQSPCDWWEGAKKAIQRLLRETAVSPISIKGVGLSGQMHSSVFLDREHEVIRPAILWSDTRTSQECQEIVEKVGGLSPLIEQVANPALEGFTAPKILWLRNHEEENFKRLAKILLPKDYIRYQLTGELKTEVSDAAGTLLFDVVSKAWSKPTLKALDLDEGLLPEVVESTAICGEITETCARATGLSPGTPVVAGGADNACGAVGSGIIREGRVLMSIGSSGVVLAQTKEPSPDTKGRIHLFNHSLPGAWYMMGVMLSAGLSYSWLKESLFNNQHSHQELGAMAGEIPPGSEKLLFLPYLYGERTPHADAKARGVFFGISGNHNQGHFARALMEGVSFGLLDSLSLIKERGVAIEELRLIGGGAKSRVWQQILADMTGEEIALLTMEEGPAFGAAILAGVGCGLFQDFDRVEEFLSIRERIEPNLERTKIYGEYYCVYQGLYQSVKEDYEKLSSLGL